MITPTKEGEMQAKERAEMVKRLQKAIADVDGDAVERAFLIGVDFGMDIEDEGMIDPEDFIKQGLLADMIENGPIL